eukprot:TRINITY_DN39435_c0_g1_i1.p1 TRINITY_DN39435_c0_g1~~TRINITY_DN39435_c0_g1_i1.p1  ORF type:complete len:230 (+),score=25.17 TRINITY_DN39435_c0_g1_i1:80-769(+)
MRAVLMAALCFVGQCAGDLRHVLHDTPVPHVDHRSQEFEHEQYAVTEKVYFDISVAGEDYGRIVIGVFGGVVPRTAANFVELARGHGEFGYKGSVFHRIIKHFVVQGGDFENQDGTGGRSIYGPRFADENFKVRHFEGAVSMANSGPDTNGSQFFICTSDAPWLNKKHVVFGRIVDGMSVIRRLERLETRSSTDRPVKLPRIVDSGVLWTEDKPVVGPHKTPGVPEHLV